MNNMISTCLLVKNEEKNIEDCLKSIVKISDEIIVVDNGSTDRTVEICKKYNCVVINKESGTESELRNEYISKARYPWIFVIDADERLDSSCEGINQYLESQAADIYRFPVNNYYGNGKWCTFITGRLFKNNNIYYKGEVHCTLSFSGNYRFGFVPIVIHHLDSLIKNRNVGKRDRYINSLLNQIKNPQYANQKMRLINYLGVEYAAINEYEKSKALFFKVFQDGGFYKDLAAVYYSQISILHNDIEGAEEMLSHLIYKNYNDTNIEIIIGEDTVKTLTEDLYQRCCVILAEIAYRKGNYEESLFWCEEGIKYWPFASQHYLNKAFILKKMNNQNWKSVKEKAVCLNEYLNQEIIYKEGSPNNIYAFQTSLLSGVNEILF